MLLGVGGEGERVLACGVLLGAKHKVGVADLRQLVVAPLLVGHSLVLVGLGLHLDIRQGERPDSVVVSALRHGLCHRPVVRLVVRPSAGEVADDAHRLNHDGLGNHLLLLGDERQRVLLGVGGEVQRVLACLVDDILIVACFGQLIVTPLLVGHCLVVVSLGLKLHVGKRERPDGVIVGTLGHGLRHRPVVRLVVGPSAGEVTDDAHRLNLHRLFEVRHKGDAVAYGRTVPETLFEGVKQVVSFGRSQVGRLVPLVLPAVLSRTAVHPTENHVRVNIIEHGLIDAIGIFHGTKIDPGVVVASVHVESESRSVLAPVGAGLQVNRLSGSCVHDDHRHEQHQCQ